MCTPSCNPSDPKDCVEPEYHLHLDLDRDGTVDDDRTGIDGWEWGAGKKGAIILCNNDGDETTSKSDNEDAKINKGNDKDEIAVLEIRRTGPPPPGDWQGFLEVSPADAARIRIFANKTAGSAEILGPGKGKKHKLPDLNFTKKELGMEATQYAGGTFTGVITITFTITRGGTVKHKEQAKVRVAPWMMPNHLDKAEKVYVCKASNLAFPTASSPPGTDVKGNDRFVGELAGFVGAAGCALEQHAEDDVWMQDCMEWGFANLPPHGFRAVFRANRDRELLPYPKTLRKTDLGYHERGDLSLSNTFDSTGNLECTPPCTSAAGKHYPFGRIYFGPGRTGELFDADVKAMLNDQLVQAPIEIDTSWLAVGHVDEILSFVPGTGSQGFKMLIASPRRAYKILQDHKAKDGASKMLVGRMFPEYVVDPITRRVTDIRWHKAEVTIQRFLDVGIGGHFPNAGVMRLFNDAKQSTLDGIRATMEREIGLKPTDTIEVPIIFMPNESSPAFADALTAGMVNMLVLNKHCIVPKPFGPVVGGKDLFEEDLAGKLRAEGLTVHFLDDWYEYHVNLGEVHCGTNTLRTPTKLNWWEFKP